jgi:hypothetical protein
MTKRIRRHHTPEQKAAWVRRHLADKVPVSDICNEYNLQPSVFSETGAAPKRPPLSIWRTHLRSVSGLQPSLVAMATMAAQSDGYSPRASRTRRTARSRTSGENFCFVSLMTPSSQRLGSPAKPGRFIRRNVRKNLGLGHASRSCTITVQPIMWRS